MNFLFYLISLCVIVGYGFATYFYWQLFFRETSIYSKWSRTALIGSLLTHGLLLVILGFITGHYPIATPGEWLLVCTWLLAVGHLITGPLSDAKHLGFFSVLPTCLGVIWAIIVLEPTAALPEKYHGNLFSLHVISSLTAFAFYTFATILGVMYLLLFRRLKTKDFDVFFRRLPPLETLEQQAALWVGTGTCFMILAPLIGWTWVRQQSGTEGMTPRETAIFIVIILFAGALGARRWFGFRGVRFIFTLLAGFVVLFLSQLLSVHGY